LASQTGGKNNSLDKKYMVKKLCFGKANLRFK
jgi:hypothetical protein